MHCPQDKSLLIDKDIWKLIGKACPKCKGIWIPYSELKTLYDNGLLAVPSQIYSEREVIHEYNHWQSNIHCPIDDKHMDTYKVQNAHIDICPTCKGLWLDEGELKKVWKGQSTADIFGYWISEFIGNIIFYGA